MKKNNLIFGMLLVSVLMVSLVSAGITGYVLRGSGIADAGYTATLQKVEGATAIVSVQTPSGTTEVVRVREGETAQVGDVVIGASNLRTGGLFRRAGADISVMPSEGEDNSEEEQEKCEKKTIKRDNTIFSSFGDKITLISTTPLLISINGQEYQLTKGKTFDLSSGGTIAVEEVLTSETVVIKVCPREEEEEEEESCTNLNLNCKWTSKLESANVGGYTATIDCKPGEIVLESSCGVADYSNMKVLGSMVKGKMVAGSLGEGWICEFLNNGKNPNQIEIGALCCS